MGDDEQGCDAAASPRRELVDNDRTHGGQKNELDRKLGNCIPWKQAKSCQENAGKHPNGGHATVLQNKVAAAYCARLILKVPSIPMPS